MTTPSPPGRAAQAGLLARAGLTATLLCPLFLTHGRGLAEAMIDVVSLGFLAESARAGAWGWLRAAWVRIGLAWWGWLVFCTLPGLAEGGSLAQALFAVRFLLFAAALEHWTLRDPAPRRWLGALVRLVTLYIVAQAALQFATGRNLFGDGRGAEGELTGPFDRARGGPILSRLLFPAMLPPAAAWLARGGAWRLAAAALPLAGVGTMVLFAQRMPLLLTGLGLVVSGLLLPRLRPLVLAALIAGGALVAASAVVSPPAFYRLVTKFSRQMADWPDSQYGWLVARALAITEQHPWTGIGADGFRIACPAPRYWHGWPDVTRGSTGFPDLTPPHGPAEIGPMLRRLGAGRIICAPHPHNHYVQALVESGIPGLLLFTALVAAWLVAVGRGLLHRPGPLRVGLFVAVLLQEWPIASSSDFMNMPLGGWFFLLLGWGLAEARWQSDGEAGADPLARGAAGRPAPVRR